jgi:hypothetical protein
MYALPILESQNWPVTQGTIISSNLQRKPGGEEGDYYHAQITYNFTVEGIVYTSSIVNIGEQGWSTARYYYERLVQKYSVGKTVSVYYNPKNPSQAVLETDLEFNTLVFFSL